MNDVIYSDDGDRLTYFSRSRPETMHTISRDGVIAAAFVARDWHGGQWSDLYKLSCGALDYDTVRGAANELALALERVPAPMNDETYDADGMIEAQQALADLEAVRTDELDAIADEET